MKTETTNQGLIEFDGHTIRYPNGSIIYINLDDDFGDYTFDVFNKDGDCLCESMTMIHQAHQLAVKGVVK